MNFLVNATVHCCAECGEEGGASLKVCKACMIVRYCNAECQRNHWPKHKKVCKQRAAELRDEALFKDPPAKEDCPICFLPMPYKLICCMSLPPATITSVPIFDFAVANGELAKLGTEQYYSCCGKSICGGCVHSFSKSGNMGKCPFCKADKLGKTDEERVQEIMRRIEVNDAGATFALGNCYQHGQLGLLSDQERAMELWKLAAELGSSQAHHFLGYVYGEGGDLKKAKFHLEAAAMAGNEEARYNIGNLEGKSGNMDQAAKHWKIAASAGSYHAMHNLLADFEQGVVSRDTIDSTLTAYNNACAEMRSEARDEYINTMRTRLL
jgi:tetratricopeptide (TPR) repeat protein